LRNKFRVQIKEIEEGPELFSESQFKRNFMEELTLNNKKLNNNIGGFHLLLQICPSKTIKIGSDVFKEPKKFFVIVYKKKIITTGRIS